MLCEMGAALGAFRLASWWRM